MYKKIGYRPYNEKQTKEIVQKIMKFIPEYCRVMRIMREIPKEKMEFKPVKLDLRKDVEEKLRESGTKINEIRMREIGFNKENLNLSLKLRTLEYNASNGKEYFLQIVNKDNILFGLLRLRIAKGKAIVRELHIYGQTLDLGEKKKGAAQHEGLGKKLLKEAENIVKHNKIKELAIISGVGVRQYYKKLGYRLKEPYMIKKI